MWQKGNSQNPELEYFYCKNGLFDAVLLVRPKDGEARVEISFAGSIVKIIEGHEQQVVDEFIQFCDIAIADFKRLKLINIKIGTKVKSLIFKDSFGEVIDIRNGFIYTREGKIAAEIGTRSDLFLEEYEILD